jgi:hypothetical protein
MLPSQNAVCEISRSRCLDPGALRGHPAQGAADRGGLQDGAVAYPLGVFLNFHMVLLGCGFKDVMAPGFFWDSEGLGLEPARTSIAFFYEPNFDAAP